MTLCEWIKCGYADNQEHTPWKRAPISFEIWHANPAPAEPPELTAYWQGFYAGAWDAYAAACRAERNTA